MAELEGIASGSIGILSFKPPAGESLVSRTLSFVLSQLPDWRDDPTRPVDSNENQMNSSLCDFLDTRSRTDFPMVRFKHQAPQTTTHTVDLGVHGLEKITSVDTRGYTIYQPFLVIEAKRLPAPSKDREREYVAGTDKPSGAIQRFRLGLHGAGVRTAAIVAYIESDMPPHWHATVNQWITTFPPQGGTDSLTWSEADELGNFLLDDAHGTSSSESNHKRTSSCCSPSIRIRHLWVVLNWKKPVA
jgi:hypothetical protein